MFVATVSAPIVQSTFAERGQSLFGLCVFIAIAFLVGRARGARTVPWRVLIWGVVLQFAFGLLVILSPGALRAVQTAIDSLLAYTRDGAKVLFGNLVDFAIPVTAADGSQIGVVQTAASFAFLVLPTILFVSMLTAMLYHLRILTFVVHALAWVMRKTTGTSGAETLSTAANIFVGQTEAPLIVRPFLAAATRSELMVIMLGGFANIATGVLVIYADWLKPFVQDAGGHLAAACFVSAPATLIVAKLLLPETETPTTLGGMTIHVEKIDANLMDAATRGTSEGLSLALNVGAMLIAFTALIALINGLIGTIGGWCGFAEPLTLQKIFGVLLAPVAWLISIPWHEADKVGSLLGIKTVLNEFIAYDQMRTALNADPTYLSPRSSLLATYALCGFANFASVGIQIGGISVMAPQRRHDLSRIGLLAMFGGAIATCMGACVIGIIQ